MVSNMYGWSTSILTFELSYSTEYNVLLRLLVLQRLQDALDDRLRKLRLLRFLGLLFVADPRIQNLFELSGHRNLLTLREDFGLKLGSFLRAQTYSEVLYVVIMAGRDSSHLGGGKETFGKVDDVLHLLDRRDSILDSLGVLRTRAGENTGNTL